MDVSIYVKYATLFCFRMENNDDSINRLRKDSKLNLNIHDNKKCEYCDWHNNCCWCEWCGKSSCSNKRKLNSVIIQRKKRNNTI